MLMVGVLLAVVAFGGVLLFGSSPGSSEPINTPTTVSVVTAALDIPLGTQLDVTQLASIEMATADATDTFRDPAQLQGRVVRRTMHQGEAFRSGDFLSTGSVSAPDVAANLATGQRAMAIAVDSISGVGSLIQAGDYVDVLLAMTDQPDPARMSVVAPFTGENGLPVTKVEDDNLNNTTIKVLVQNVQILGIVAPALAADGTNTQTDPNTGLPSTGNAIAILSVTPQEAELVRFAQLDGNLTLLMRSPADAAVADEETTGVTLRLLVEDYGVLAPRPIVIPLP